MCTKSVKLHAIKSETRWKMPASLAYLQTISGDKLEQRFTAKQNDLDIIQEAGVIVVNYMMLYA